MEQLKVAEKMLAAANQVPDPGQRRQFIEKFSHAGMLKIYASGGREINLEYRRYTGNGLIWVHTRVAMLPDPDSGDILAFFYTRDIDEEKILQEVMSNGVYIAELDSKRYTRVDTLSPLGPISTSYMPISWDNGDTA